MGGRFNKVVILAAGRGKRLEHETVNLPKALVSVGGSSLLELILENIRLFTGIRSAIVATGHLHEMIEQRLGRERGGIELEYIINSDYESTDNCYTLWLLREYLVDGFLLVNTDVLFDGRILEKAGATPYEDFIVVDTAHSLDLEDMKVRLDDSRVVEMSKELYPSESDGEYIGILGFGACTSQALVEELDSAVKTEGERGIYYEDVICRMLGERSIYAVRCDPHLWIEVDTLEDLALARSDIYPRIAGVLGWS